jgi:putative glutamine amidotransferase
MTAKISQRSILMSYLFVYGTLVPGSTPACVADLMGQFQPVGRATVRGVLYDLRNYPGLVFDRERERDVPGFLLEFPSDDQALLRRLDAYEGFDPNAPTTSLFRRVPATATLTDSGRAVDCQVYVYNRPKPGDRVIATGAWANRDSAAALSAVPSTDELRSMAKRPTIGITVGYSDANPSRYESPSDYARAVERAGGLPILLPFRADLSLIPDYADLIDGIVFTGGDDLDPALFGEARHPNAIAVDPDRQRFELALIAEIERRKMPALGVCMGSQLMNIHRGGSLIQYLPDESRESAVEHRHLGDNTYRHPIRLEPQSLLGKAIGRPEIIANSRHKQSVRKLGRGLRVNAVAPDGVIEGFEDPDLPLFLAVQWHPENLAGSMSEHQAPFDTLVRVAMKK